MTALAVVGGCYREVCLEPFDHDEFIGSGGRAAWVMRAFDRSCDLHACVDAHSVEDVTARCAALGISLHPYSVSSVPSFRYRHPLSRPRIIPTPGVLAPSVGLIDVRADVVLQFGMLETHAVVHGRTVVYDPQSAFEPRPFATFGSSATRLAVIANEAETRNMLAGATAPVRELARDLRRSECAEVAVVKCGPHGAWIATGDGEARVACRTADRVWPIGSGDVFAAMFAVRWAADGVSALDAAQDASCAVAHYVDTLAPPSREQLVSARRATPIETVDAPRQVYLAAPFFTMSERWLVDEVRACMPSSVTVFSPLHEVGRGSWTAVAPLDLAAIDASDVVLAIANGGDPGTLVEIGYARAHGIPVIVLSEQLKEEDLVMVRGLGCVVTADLSSAVYHATWLALRPVATQQP